MVLSFQNFLDKVRLYIFRYKRGFFELPFINTSPQLMWKSFKSMPFCNYDERKDNITANNPFVNADVYYHELDNGLILIYSTVSFKRNIIYKQVFLKQVESNYYSINLFVNEAKPTATKTIMHDVHFNGQLWMLAKPGALVNNYHFKNTISKTINFYFTKDWLDNYLKDNIDQQALFNHFIASKNGVFTTNTVSSNLNSKLMQRLHNLMNQHVGKERDKHLGAFIIELMNAFKTDSLQNMSLSEQIHLNNIDRIKLLEVEQLLHLHVYKKFPGISYLAKEVSLSETKLKELFKKVHGRTIYDYYQSFKMNIAKGILEQQAVKIGTIAENLGYENASKFSAAFKNQFNYLPSEVGKKTS